MKHLITGLLILSFTSIYSQTQIDYNGRKFFITKKLFGELTSVPGRYISDLSYGGHVVLNADCTGEFEYDKSGFATEGCVHKVIKMTWGFICDENGKPKKNEERDDFYFYEMILIANEKDFDACSTDKFATRILFNKGEMIFDYNLSWKKSK